MCALGGCAAAGPADPATTGSPSVEPAAAGSGTTDLMVFGAAATGENPDLFTIRLDGTERVQLTDDPAFDACATFGPDARTVVFCSDRSGAFEIWATDIEGATARQLTSIGGFATFPDVSPDGRTVAFCANAPGEPEETEDLWTVGLDGSAPIRITDTPKASDCYPSWSPDGDRTAFVSSREDGPNVWVVNADGSGATRLTTDSGVAEQLPDWSPDGSSIAFAADGEVWTMDADGSAAEPITSGVETEFSPAWTGDGDRIVYRVIDRAAARNELWVMSADGGDAQRIPGVEDDDAFRPAVAW
ncbi:PD40 domain-containing protein [Agromyces sp. LHK192]|uniref:TolB family protein n=1 Tax=Agromyces sp. LHK192 TaxID=2498704 RepID=UPI000FD6C729|nr:PD40 domain-containing protein [Agromyces sp. LHK192]